MAVLVEGISVIVNGDSIRERFNEWDDFVAIVPNQTLCADDEVIRVGFMAPDGVKRFIERLQGLGVVYRDNGKAVDLTVVDQRQGLLVPCDWLDVGRIQLDGNTVMAARLKGSNSTTFITPDNWKFEESLSKSNVFVPTEKVNEKMTYLRNENGVAVYLDNETGKEIYGSNKE